MLEYSHDARLALRLVHPNSPLDENIELFTVESAFRLNHYIAHTFMHLTLMYSRLRKYSPSMNFSIFCRTEMDTGIV